MFLKQSASWGLASGLREFSRELSLLVHKVKPLYISDCVTISDHVWTDHVFWSFISVIGSTSSPPLRHSYSALQRAVPLLG